MQIHLVLLAAIWRRCIHSKHMLPPYCLAASSRNRMEGNRHFTLVDTVRLLQVRAVGAARPASWRAANQWLRLEGGRSRAIRFVKTQPSGRLHA